MRKKIILPCGLLILSLLIGCSSIETTSSENISSIESIESSEGLSSEESISLSEEESSEPIIISSESNEESSEESIVEPHPLLVFINGIENEIEDIKNNDSIYQGEYIVDLIYEDQISFKDNDYEIHFYHHGKKDIDDGNIYQALTSGSYHFYYTFDNKMFVEVPNNTKGEKPDLGVFPLSLWNEDVKNNYISFGLHEDYSYTYVHSSFDEEYMYFYIRQYVTVYREIGDGWWENDNVELRLSRYLDSECPAFNTQLWASTLNGGSFSEFISGKVRRSDAQSFDEMNLIEYEIKVQYFGGLSCNDNVVVLAGANLTGGWSFYGENSGWAGEGGNGCKGRSPLDKIITKNGLVYNVDSLGAGVEKLSSEVVQSGTAWNSQIVRQNFHAKDDFALKVECDFVLDKGMFNYDENKWDTTICGDIFGYSPIDSYSAWSKGGMTWRGDWWMQNPWTTTNGDEGGNGGPTRYVYSNEFGNDWFTFRRDMHITIYVVYHSKEGYIDVCLYMRNNIDTNSHWVQLFSTPVCSEGRSLKNYVEGNGHAIAVCFGRTNSKSNVTISFKSMKVLYGKTA